MAHVLYISLEYENRKFSMVRRDVRLDESFSEKTEAIIFIQNPPLKAILSNYLLSLRCHKK